MSKTAAAGEVLKRLWYYADALSGLSFERIEDVSTASAPIVRSVLKYQSAVVALRRDNDIPATATAFAPRSGIPAGELDDVVKLSQRLLESVEETGVIETSTLDHDLQQVLRRLQLGDVPCVAPIRVAVKNVPQSIGIVVIGGPPRHSDAKTDRLVLDLIASLIGGATSSTIARMDLRRINRHLEETVAQRTQELANAIQVANSANHAKSAFLANMSHEIRTPMTAILGFAEMLDEMVTTSQQSDAVNTIRRNGEHLLEVINDILDISKIEAGKVEIERVLLSPFQLITEVESLMDIRASAGGLSLKVEYDGPIPERINSDPTRLRQTLINIVGNAVKFTKAGGIRMVVRLLGRASAEPSLQIRVIDTGIGMTAQQLTTLFQPFMQADASTTRRFGCSGLGLAISQQLARMLGGDICAESTPDHGSTFTISVATGPLAGIANREDSAVPTTPRSLEATPKFNQLPLCQKILLAEDSPDNQRLISFILKKAGADVTIADNGQIALDLALAAGSSFDVILMDMQMPILDGCQATGRLRQAGFTKPIIALTANAMQSDRQKCLEAGCDDFVTKPIDRQKLIEIIAGIVQIESQADPKTGVVCG